MSFSTFKLGIPTLYVSAHHGEGVDRLKRELRGERCVFVGHSGVGKTSLLNALIPDLREAVNELSEATGKGQHTTTTSTLYTITVKDESDTSTLEIIDSPGIRAFGLWQMPAHELKDHFQEFLSYAPYCHFNNCVHIMEPKCAVLEAVESDEIPFERYDAYVRIYEDLLDEGE